VFQPSPIRNDKCKRFVESGHNQRILILAKRFSYTSPVDDGLFDDDLDSVRGCGRLFPFPLLLLGLLLSRRFFFLRMYLFCLVANSVKVIVTSLTVIEC